MLQKIHTRVNEDPVFTGLLFIFTRGLARRAPTRPEHRAADGQTPGAQGEPGGASRANNQTVSFRKNNDRVVGGMPGRCANGEGGSASDTASDTVNEPQTGDKEPSALAVTRAWPWVVLDMLQSHDALSPRSAMRRMPSIFTPQARRTHSSKRAREEGEYGRDEASVVVENEPGLCDTMAATVAAACIGQQDIAQAQLELTPARRPDVAPLATIVADQLRGSYLFPMRRLALTADGMLGPPVLFSALVVNSAVAEGGEAGELMLEALGARWLLPPGCAFFLSKARRWRELGPLRPAGGYRLCVVDPPWHSRSAQRASVYRTCDKREILHDAAAALEALCSPEACLVCVWVTNSRHVQAFVEDILFARCGARPIARWYWAKLDTSGQWASGVDPYSPHRKPWEVLLIGHIGERAPPSLPARLVICATPHLHSAKPPLDAIDDMVRAAPQLLHPDSSSASISVGRADSVSEPLEPEDAWRRLPKLELYARELRPHWHSCGDEVLHFQHVGFYERSSSHESTKPRTSESNTRSKTPMKIPTAF
jgi:N6-adenosine-specific RNA methylase IME4